MGSKTYMANPRLKKSGVLIPFTKEQHDEYALCAKDAEYFIEKYMKIVNVDRGLIPFSMYGYQKRMVKTFNENRFSICKLPRQTGKSTTVVAFMLWLILFKDQQKIAILANKGALARDMLAKIQLAYENLPMWMQQGIKTWNKGDIELENGSKIVAEATSSSAIRGGTYNLIFLDEFAFIQRNIAENFFNSVYPTISSGDTTKIIIVSTPNGLNHFYKRWIDATEGRSTYVPIEVHWRDTPGRDDKWREETIKNTSEEQFKQEFETEFLGSVHTLISGSKLRQLAFKDPQKNNYGIEVHVPPVKGGVYTICVDTAHGAGLDYSAFSVVDVTKIPYMQVAKFYDNHISPQVYPDVIAAAARYYNDAYVLVETNDIGQQVADTLHYDLEVDNVLSTVTKGRAGQSLGGGFGKRQILGVKMNKAVKRVGCSNLKDLIEADKLIVQDFDTINELSNFIHVKDSFEAEDGEHDDLVMSLVLFAWLSRQAFFRDLTNTDIRAKLAQEAMEGIENDMLPAGYIDDGHTEEAESLERPSNYSSWITLDDD